MRCHTSLTMEPISFSRSLILRISVPAFNKTCKYLNEHAESEIPSVMMMMMKMMIEIKGNCALLEVEGKGWNGAEQGVDGVICSLV